MNVSFRKSFVRDLKKLKDQKVRARVQNVIEQVEAADSLQEAGDLAKMSGTEDCYRIRVGDYRIGVVLQQDTIEFVRCLHRCDLYRFFP